MELVHTMFYFWKTIEEIMNIEEKEIYLAIDWFKENNMIVNLDKLQNIAVKRSSQMSHTYILNVNSLNAKVAITSYRNQSIDLQGKSIDWFLYDDNFCV